MDDARRTPHAAFVFSILMVCNRPILTSDYLKGDCVPFFDNINNHDHKRKSFKVGNRKKTLHCVQLEFA